MGRLIDCRETSRMLAEGTFEAGPAWKRALAAAHLLICRYCRRYRVQLAVVRKAASRWMGSRLDPSRVAALEAKLVERFKGGSPG